MEHIYKRRVQFADTDAAGVVHFSRILCYVEEAEHDLLDALSIPVMGNGGWPRVHVDCDYRAPVRLGHSVDIMISPLRIGHSSIQWAFSMTIEGQCVAEGEMKTVRVDQAGNPVELNGAWRASLTG